MSSFDKLAKKDNKGHLSPGTTAMIGALLGPTGAAAGAEVGRRGRATEGSPALRAAGGSIGGALSGAALGGLSVAAILKAKGLSNKVRSALLKKKLKSSKGLKAKLLAAGKLGRHKAKLRIDKPSAMELSVLDDANKVKSLLGAGAGGIGGYFEGARRGAQSVKYKDKEAGVGRKVLKGVHSLTAPVEYGANVTGHAVGGAGIGGALGGILGTAAGKGAAKVMGKGGAEADVLAQNLANILGGTGALIGGIKGAGHGTRTTRMARKFRMMTKADQKAILNSLKKGKSKAKKVSKEVAETVSAPIAKAVPKSKLEKMKALAKKNPKSTAAAAGTSGVGLAALLKGEK